MTLGTQVGELPPSAQTLAQAPALGSGSSSPHCKPAAPSPSRRPPRRLQGQEGMTADSPSQATSPHPGPPGQPSPASHSACVALGLELLATNRQMEKRRQPRSHALMKTALSYSFLDLEESSCSSSSWEGGHGAQARRINGRTWVLEAFREGGSRFDFPPPNLGS